MAKKATQNITEAGGSRCSWINLGHNYTFIKSFLIFALLPMLLGITLIVLQQTYKGAFGVAAFIFLFIYGVAYIPFSLWRIGINNRNKLLSLPILLPYIVYSIFVTTMVWLFIIILIVTYFGGSYYDAVGSSGVILLFSIVIVLFFSRLFHKSGE